MADGTGPIGIVLLFFMFLIVWFVFLGGWIRDIFWGVIDSVGLSGIEAFFYANFNIVIFIVMILGMMAWLTIGGRQ